MLPSTDQQTAETIQVHQPINVAFQGERGAFSDEAVRAYFGQQAEPLPYRSFADVFRAVAAGEVDYGLVPVENSQAGSINDVYDLLRQHDLFVIGEISHPVNHCLLCLQVRNSVISNGSSHIRRRWRRATRIYVSLAWRS